MIGNKKTVFFILILAGFTVAVNLYPVSPAKTPVPQEQFRYVRLHFDGSGFDLAQNEIRTVPAVILDSDYGNYSEVLLGLDGAEIESHKFQVRTFTTYYDESNGSAISGGGSFEEYEKFVKLTFSPDGRARFLEIRDTGGNVVRQLDLQAPIACNFDFYCENARGENSKNCQFDCPKSGATISATPASPEGITPVQNATPTKPVQSASQLQQTSPAAAELPAASPMTIGLAALLGLAFLAVLFAPKREGGKKAE